MYWLSGAINVFRIDDVTWFWLIICDMVLYASVAILAQGLKALLQGFVALLHLAAHGDSY